MSKNRKTRRPGDRQVAIPLCGAKAPLSNAGLALPHERDESIYLTADVPDPVMVQAKRDIDACLDAKLRARLVAGPGGKPPPSGG